jgi:GNAT superfamily N-acetyltransferase
MSEVRLAPLPAAQADAALALLDAAFADDPSLGWYLMRERPGFGARRRAYLQAYLAFHRDNRLPVLAAWRGSVLCGLSLFDLAQTPSSDSVHELGRRIADTCGADCLARLDRLLAAFDQQLPEGCARLEFLAVAPHSQGQGLGGALLQATLQAMAAAGCSAAALETGAERSLALYRRHGFELLGRADSDALRQYSLWRPTIAQVEPGAATGTPIR